MSEQEYFKDAMSNFTFEVASGGAIRHLADLGYTVNQIMKQLTFPTPYERVQKTVWEHLLDTGVVLLEEPGCGSKREKVTYVRDYDKYGKPSFRRVVVSEDTMKSKMSMEKNAPIEQNSSTKQNDSMEQGVFIQQKNSIEESCSMGSINWKELHFQEDEKSLAEFLKEKCTENGQEMAYFSCDFGLRLYNQEKTEGFMDALRALEEQHRDYILGLPWDKKLCYHRLDKRMREILVKLYAMGAYQGACYFLKTGERMIL